jgi:hypothetical protein
MKRKIESRDLQEFFILTVLFVGVIGLIMQAGWLSDVEKPKSRGKEVHSTSGRWHAKWRCTPHHFSKMFAFEIENEIEMENSNDDVDSTVTFRRLHESCADARRDVCEAGTYCHASTFRCEAEPAVGDSCKTHGDCVRGIDSHELRCIQFRCDVKRWAGEKCVRSEQCYSRHCDVDGRCARSAQSVQVLADNVHRQSDRVDAATLCDPRDDNRCGVGEFCSGTEGVCTPSVRRGKLCNSSVSLVQSPSNAWAACEPGNVCDGEQCVAMFGVDSDTPCTSHERCRHACRFGLAFDGAACREHCADSVRCLAGTCVCADEHKGSCILGAEHRPGEHATNEKCAHIVETLVACARRNRCYMIPTHLLQHVDAPNTCLREHCSLTQTNHHSQLYRQCLRHLSPLFYS